MCPVRAGGAGRLVGLAGLRQGWGRGVFGSGRWCRPVIGLVVPMQGWGAGSGRLSGGAPRVVGLGDAEAGDGHRWLTMACWFPPSVGLHPGSHSLWPHGLRFPNSAQMVASERHECADFEVNRLSTVGHDQRTTEREIRTVQGHHDLVPVPRRPRSCLVSSRPTVQGHDRACGRPGSPIWRRPVASAATNRRIFGWGRPTRPRRPAARSRAPFVAAVLRRLDRPNRPPGPRRGATCRPVGRRRGPWRRGRRGRR